MIRRLAALIALLLFGSIESVQAQRSYPTLARRPVESRDRDAEIVKAAVDRPAVPPLDTATVTELTRLGGQATTAGQGFDQDFAASDRLVAAAGNAAPASESWVVAQEAISALDARRFESVTALAGMDRIYVAQLDKGGDSAAVEGYRAPVAAMVDRQNDRLDSLRGRLAQP
ncbi:MAG TPA: hypothetical protein VF475_00935 [Sphingobium sp.]